MWTIVFVIIFLWISEKKNFLAKILFLKIDPELMIHIRHSCYTSDTHKKLIKKFATLSTVPIFVVAQNDSKTYT